MRWAWVSAALALATQVSAAKGAPEANIDFLELHPLGNSDTASVPVYLAFPDTVGSVPVRFFLEAPEEKIRGALEQGIWSAKPLSKPEKEFLISLRALAAGRFNEARETMAAASRHLPKRLIPCHRINTALMLYLAGLKNDAEAEWRRSLTDGGPAAEGAWRNLYSLYLGRRDFVKAHGLVEAALVKAPRNRWAVAAKGYLLHMLAPEDEVGDFLREKSSWKDSLHSMQVAYGKFLKDRGQWQEAARYYNLGLEGDPKNGPAWLELADVYYHLGYLVFSETCVRKAFKVGVNDPFVFELYALVLRDIGRGMVDSAKAREIWRSAEKVLEEGFGHDLQSRSMAQLLYHLYCGNGKVDAAENLRNGFWYHFSGPPRPARLPLRRPGPARDSSHLRFRLSYVTFPLVIALQSSDFFEPF